MNNGGLIAGEDLDALVEQTQAHGGLISHKQNPDGTQSPYELNINYFDSLSNPNGHEPLELQVDRFMAAQAIMLALRGVPEIYFHSLCGSRNWKEGVEITHHNRTINFQKLAKAYLEKELVSFHLYMRGFSTASGVCAYSEPARLLFTPRVSNRSWMPA